MLALLRRYSTPLSRAFFMVLISNGLLVLNPLVLRQAVSYVYDQGKGGTPWLETLLGGYVSFASTWVLLFLLIAFVSAYFKYRMRVAFVAVSREEERRLRLRIFRRLQRQSMAFFDRHPIGDLMSSLTNDIAAYREVLGPGIMYPLYFITMVTPALIALYSLSAPLAFFSILPILCMPFMILVTQHKVYQTSREVQDILGQMSTYAHEHYAGIRINKSYAHEKEASQRFDGLGDRFYKVSLWLSCLRGIFFPFLALFTKAVTVLLVLGTGYSAYYGWSTLSTADFVAFMWVQSYIFGPVLMLGWVLPLYQRGGAAYDRLRDLYVEPVEVQSGPKTGPSIPAGAKIEFRQLSFTYPTEQQPALKNVQLSIAGGSFVGITGPVGSGKSTLLRLLNRQYAVEKEMIFIGDHEIHEYSLDRIHEAIGIVEQTPFLFSKSVAENVGFGMDDPSMDEIESVARLADLHDSVIGFPSQYQTVVGERGVKLSGGQKQRVALARAFLVNRSILLLDDVFSAVDADTEQRIMANIREQLKGMTVLLVTHRAPILKAMDRVLYLSDGRVIEDGTPEELVGIRGRFSALVDLQMLSGGARPS